MPAPPRNKLYNKTGKHKTIHTSYGASSSAPPAAPVDNNSSAAAVPFVPDTEADRQLELELCWCIQTLETSLDTGKLNAKQGKSYETPYIFIHFHCYAIRTQPKTPTKR